MITLLLVGSEDGSTLAGPTAAPPSVELLRSANADEALEVLSRNRRIDAVLFLDADSAAKTAALLAEEGPSWPPLFQVGEAGESAVPGAIIPLDPASVLEDLLGRLGE